MALRQTSSPVPVISKKQFEKEEKELIKKIQLTTKETNELRDRLIYVTEGSMNKRYTLLQNLWCQSGVFNVSLILSFEGGGFYEAVPPDCPYAQPHIHECFIAERQNLKLG